MKHKNFLFLAVILFVALSLRVYQLDKAPASLFGDEVDVGYNAYSLLKTGQDLRGNSWPILIHSLSEYRAPLFIYSEIPFIAIFGLNEWGVRLASVFWSLLGIAGVYLLARELLDEKAALLAAAFLALSPWYMQYSRAAFEVTMLLTFIVFGAYFFLKGLKSKYLLPLSAVLFALTPYIYSTAGVFMPLLVVLLILIYGRELFVSLSIKYTIVAFFVAVLILLPYTFQTFSGRSGERFGLISIFTDQVLKDKVTLAQKFGGDTNTTIEKIFHNKPLIWAQVFILNYLRAFSPEFLFLQGDPNFRQSIHEMGEMYYFELIPLLFGLALALKLQYKQKNLILGWLLLAPAPAALTADGGFHATRTFLMLVPLGILVSLGISHLWNLKKDKKIGFILAAVVILALFNIPFYLHRYFVHYPVESARAWNYGFKQSMTYLNENQAGYSRILINNSYEPALIRFLFWTKYDPVLFHQQFGQDQPIKNIVAGYDGFKLGDKYIFGKLNVPYQGVLNKQTLLIASARDEITDPSSLTDPRVKLLTTVYSPDNLPIFYILTGEK